MSDLAHRTIKNTGFAFIGFLWPLIVSLVATPFIINGLGSSQYGFYLLLNASIALFTLLDFGFNYLFIKQLSSNQKDIEISHLFSSTVIAYFLLGSFALIIIMLLPDFFKDVFKIPDGFIPSYLLAFFIIGITFVIRMLTTPISLIPYALQRLDVGTRINVVNMTITQMVSALLVNIGYGVMSLLVVQFVSAAFMFICYFYYWKKLASYIKFKFYFSKVIFKEILKDGIWVFVGNFMISILTQLDKFVLGIFYGPTLVTYYSVAQMIPEKINVTSTSASQAFFPVFSSLSDSGSAERIKDIFRRSIKIILLLSSVLSTLVFVYGYKLLQYWVGQEFADNSYVAMLFLVVTYFFLSIATFMHFYLNGIKQIKFVAKYATLIAALDFFIMIFLIPIYKVNGAALAYMLSTFPVLFFLYVVERKYLRGERKEIVIFYIKNFLQYFFVGLIVYLLGAYLLIPLCNNLLSTITIGMLTFMAYLAIYWVLGFFEEGDVVLFRQFISNYINKLRIIKKI